MKQSTAIIAILVLIIFVSAFLVFLFRMMEPDTEIESAPMQIQNPIKRSDYSGEKNNEQQALQALDNMQSGNIVTEEAKQQALQALDNMQNNY